MLILLGSAGWLLLAAPVAVPTRPALPADAPPIRYAQISIRERVIVRVPMVSRSKPKPTRQTWQEKKGPRCIAMKDLAGAAITEPASVDLVLRGSNMRVRAELESACPALEYYSGFYIAPTEDGMVCADRDAIHTRAGGECQIERFRKLVPKEK
ncbi:hypothetical protein [Flavisphingomonas formosensis]|uniref:hypothetical protein n=1 Tax=Flavisphingomonas formosensis TaxID=861534 RepID=UPI0012F8BF55|nr:hypothetical protein [Sphingomonas formosensis]